MKKYFDKTIKKATKENAFKLVSYYYDIVAKNETVIDMTDDFLCFEQISKGYAMLDISRNDILTKKQKNIMYKLIMEI